MTSGDGAKPGYDNDGIWYTLCALDIYMNKFNNAEDRVGIFWAGGFTSVDDFAAINKFNKVILRNKGKLFYDIHSDEDFRAQGLDRRNKAASGGKFWRAVNRASKAIAAGATGGTAYVYMKPNNCRDIFSPSSQNPQDADPDHSGLATNGEIWYYAELPMLMRNSNINKIVTFYQKDGTQGRTPEDFIQTAQWDASQPNAKARDFIADVQMDATPIRLPSEARRGPLKHDESLSSISSTEFTKLFTASNTPPSLKLNSSSNIVISREPVSTAMSQKSSSLPSTGSNMPLSDSVLAFVSQGSPNLASLSTTRSAGSNLSVTGEWNSAQSTFSTITSATQRVPTNSAMSITTSQIASPPMVGTKVSISPIGTQASSTAQALHSNMVVMGPIIQSLIDNPTKSKAQDIINKIRDIVPLAENLAKEIGPPQSSRQKSCSVPKSIFDIFNAVKCVTDYFKKAIEHIQKGVDDNFPEMNSIKDDLTNLQDIQPAINKESEDNKPTDKSPSSTAEQTPSSAGKQSQTTTSTSTSCTDVRTASACRAVCLSTATSTTGASLACSMTCYSTFAGCSATGTISTITSEAPASACPLTLGGGPFVPSSTAPPGPYLTAWWDYGISCAGPLCSDLMLGTNPTATAALSSVLSTTTGHSLEYTSSASITPSSPQTILSSTSSSMTLSMSSSLLSSSSSAPLPPTLSSPTLSTLNSPPPLLPPLTTTSSPLPAASPTTPYAQGTCSLHLRQWKNPNKEGTGKYTLEITIYDNNHARIGYQSQISASARNPVRLNSCLEDTLVCIPGQHNDYIDFALGTQSWRSDGEFGPNDIPRCTVGGWDEHILEYNREMDCEFSCTWGGGPPFSG